MLQQLRRLAAVLPQAADDVSAARGAIEQRVQPVLRAIVDEESDNRRRLFQLRASPAYEQAYSIRPPGLDNRGHCGATGSAGEQGVGLAAFADPLQSRGALVGDAIEPEVEEAVAALGDPRVHYAEPEPAARRPSRTAAALVGGKHNGPQRGGSSSRGRWLLHFDDDDRRARTRSPLCWSWPASSAPRSPTEGLSSTTRTAGGRLFLSSAPVGRLRLAGGAGAWRLALLRTRAGGSPPGVARHVYISEPVRRASECASHARRGAARLPLDSLGATAVALLPTRPRRSSRAAVGPNRDSASVA